MKTILLSLLIAATAAMAAEPTKPVTQPDFSCHFTGRMYEDLGGNQFKLVDEEELSLPLRPTPGQSLTQILFDHQITVFVCPTDPVSEIDVFVHDFNENRFGISMAHASAPFFSHYSEIKLDQKRKLDIGVFCSQVK